MNRAPDDVWEDIAFVNGGRRTRSSVVHVRCPTHFVGLGTSSHQKDNYYMRL